MIINLKDRNGNNLRIKDYNALVKKSDALFSFYSKNPTKGIKNKFISLIKSETWATLFTEGEISSRRSIDQVSKSLDKISDSNQEKYIQSFFHAYHFALDKKEFSISNFFNIYSILSKFGIDKEDKLNDGEMYRNEKVFISSNRLNDEYEGFHFENIKESLKDLCNFLNEDNDLNLYIKAIIGHFYFEIIHPYFDYNGRTGRFIPLWLFNNNNRVEEMMYFATAVGIYRETYISIFRNSINPRTYDVNLDYFISKILDLLILNQKQYIWYKQLENDYLNKYQQKINDVQKRFIWSLMIKIEKQGNADSWNSLDEDMIDYIESEIKQSQLARDINILVNNKVILKTSTKPMKYKLINYTLQKEK